MQQQTLPLFSNHLPLGERSESKERIEEPRELFDNRETSEKNHSQLPKTIEVRGEAAADAESRSEVQPGIPGVEEEAAGSCEARALC